VWLWTAFGLAISNALVVTALLFRPESAAAPAAPAASEASAPVVTLAPPAAGLRINLRVGPETPSAREETIVAALRAAGYDLIEVHEMPFPILRSRVGFFDETDRAAAASLAAALAPLTEATGGPLELRDYGTLDVVPAPGRLDLWIGG
jgi:hypothetical protein